MPKCATLVRVRVTNHGKAEFVTLAGIFSVRCISTAIVRVRFQVTAKRPSIYRSFDQCSAASPVSPRLWSGFGTMSGLEIMGLVVGAIPVAVLTLEKSKQGCRAFRDWKKFNRIFSSFVRSMELQQVNLEMKLDLLLRPTVDSEADLEAMLRDPRPPFWHTPRYDNALRTHLHHAYHTFQEATAEMHQILQGILRRLKAVETSVQQKTDHRQNLPGHLQALKFCFDTRKLEQLVSRLAVLNGNICDLVEVSTDLLPLRQRPLNETDQRTDRTQHDANELYEALQASWNCDCQEPHTVLLPLILKRPKLSYGGASEHLTASDPLFQLAA